MDIESNRSIARYSRREQCQRIAWWLATPLFRWSPRPFFAWRRMLLRLFGARVGHAVNVYPSSRVYFPWNLVIGDWSAIGENADIYDLGLVTIGRKVTISQNAHLCAGTHDFRNPTMPLLKIPIRVEDNAWIATDAFVGPGVTVGEGAVVGARAVVTRDVEPWVIMAGNPAVKIGHREMQQDAS